MTDGLRMRWPEGLANWSREEGCGMRDAGALVLMLVPVCGGADGDGRRDSADDAGDVEVVVAVAVGVVGVEDVSDVCVVRVAVVAAAVVGGIGGVILL